MDKFWKIVLYVFLGFIAMGAILHASQVSQIFGTLFTGVNQIGTTLEA